MPADPSWLARARRSLADRLERLRDHLDTLQSRLREEVARAAAQTAAGAVRDAVESLLGEGRTRPFLPNRSSSGYWDAGPHSAWAEDPNEFEEDHYPSGERGSWAPAVSAEKNQPAPGRWGAALAVGLQVLSWGLRRQAGWLLALGWGLGATLAAYLGGALLAGSLCTLLALAGAIHFGAERPSHPATY
jgi:hypothetical protein